MQTVLTVIGFVVIGFLTLVLTLFLVRYHFFCKSHKDVPDMETIRERLLSRNRKRESDVDIVMSLKDYFARRRYKKAYRRVQKEREMHVRRAAESLWWS